MPNIAQKHPTSNMNIRDAYNLVCKADYEPRYFNRDVQRLLDNGTLTPEMPLKEMVKRILLEHVRILKRVGADKYITVVFNNPQWEMNATAIMRLWSYCTHFPSWQEFKAQSEFQSPFNMGIARIKKAQEHEKPFEYLPPSPLKETSGKPCPKCLKPMNKVGIVDGAYTKWFCPSCQHSEALGE